MNELGMEKHPLGAKCAANSKQSDINCPYSGEAAKFLKTGVICSLENLGEKHKGGPLQKIPQFSEFGGGDSPTPP